MPIARLAPEPNQHTSQRLGAHSGRSHLLLSAGLSALLAIACSGAAAAESTEEMAARISALEAMIAELRADMDATSHVAAQAESHAAIAIERVETVQQAPTAAAAASGNGLMIGNTQIAYGGHIDLDVHVTDLSDGEFASSSIARDFYIPGATPVGGTGEGEADTDFTAQSSRFYFTTSTPTDIGEVKTRIEFDFLASPGGNERVSNSFNPRLRRAEITFGNWMAGQSWSTFQNTSAIPESVSFLLATDGMIFMRQPQVRYTLGNWQFALENPDTTVTPLGGGGLIEADDGAVPDMVVRYNHAGQFGNVSVSLLGRALSYENGAIDGDTTGWGASVSGRLNVPTGDIRFTANLGEGLGRYMALNAAAGAVVTPTGNIEAVGSYGGLVSYRHLLGEGRRANLGYAFLEIDNDVALTGSSVTRSTYSAFANYIMDLAPGLSVGAEFMFGERQLENDQSGSISRFTFSTKYAF